MGEWVEESFGCTCNLASHSLGELALSCFLLVIYKLVLTLPDPLVPHRLWLLGLAVTACSSVREGWGAGAFCGLPGQVGRLLSPALSGNVTTVSVGNPCSSCVRAYAHMATRVQRIILGENTPAWCTVQLFVSRSVLIVILNFHLSQWKSCI